MARWRCRTRLLRVEPNAARVVHTAFCRIVSRRKRYRHGGSYIEAWGHVSKAGWPRREASRRRRAATAIAAAREAGRPSRRDRGSRVGRTRSRRIRVSISTGPTSSAPRRAKEAHIVWSQTQVQQLMDAELQACVSCASSRRERQEGWQARRADQRDGGASQSIRSQPMAQRRQPASPSAAAELQLRPGNALYVAGTNAFVDGADASTLPLRHRRTRCYEAAPQSLDESLGIDQLIGHSLGGTVALQLQIEYNTHGRMIHTTTHGAPVFVLPLSARREHKLIPFATDVTYSAFSRNMTLAIVLIKIRTHYVVTPFDTVIDAGHMTLGASPNPFKLVNCTRQVQKAHRNTNFNSESRSR